MANVKINIFIFTIVGILYLIAAWLLYSFSVFPKETIASSWLIYGKVTDYMSKQSFIIKQIIIFAFIAVMFLAFLFYSLHTNKEYITFYGRYGTYKIKTENVPNFLGVITIIILMSLDMYLYDVLEFNTSGTFFFFNFPFIIVYVVLILVLLAMAILKYGIK